MAPLPCLAQAVDQHVVRQDGVRPVAHLELANVAVTAPFELVQLGDEALRIDDHPLPEDARDPLPEHAARDEADDDLLVPDDERVARVRTAARSERPCRRAR